LVKRAVYLGGDKKKEDKIGIFLEKNKTKQKEK